MTQQVRFIPASPEELTDNILKGVDRKLEEFYKKLNKEEKVDELLTVEEALKFLKCSKQALWNWRKKGILNSYRLGNRVYYLKSDIFKQLIKQN